MRSKNYILRCIREYALESMNEPRWGLPKGYFEQRSYSKAAVEEILAAIRKSDSPPYMVVEDFMRKMDKFALCKSRTSVMFSIAYDMAENILDFLLAMN